MFNMMELLSDETIDSEDAKVNIEKAKGVAMLGKVVIDLQKTELQEAKMRFDQQRKLDKVLVMDEIEAEPEQRQIERPKAEYSNPQWSDNG